MEPRDPRQSGQLRHRIAEAGDGWILSWKPRRARSARLFQIISLSMRVTGHAVFSGGNFIPERDRWMELYAGTLPKRAGG